MDRQDYALMIDVVYRAWGYCEALFLLTAERVLGGEPGLDAQLVQCRENRDRALLDLTTLRSQTADVSHGPAPMPVTTKATTRTQSPARLRLTSMNRDRKFADVGPDGRDATA